ncbi:MAG: FtsW/RodA/SpoVE family cell cycle protein [Acidimicrobiia bacterium]
MINRLAARRRTSELGLLIMALLVIGSGYLLTALADKPDIPADLWGLLAIMAALMLVAHLAVRHFVPRADGTLLPLVALLTGIGFVTISRLDKHLARVQATWVAVGVLAFVLTLALVRRVRVLERYRYTFMILGLGALFLPLAPAPIGQELFGARLWVRVGPIQVQPSEASKVFLVIFAAAYLADKQEVLAEGTLRMGGVRLPHPKHLGPLLFAWGTTITLMVVQKDLGSSLLFFAIFTAMLYMATGRKIFLVGGGIVFIASATLAYHLFEHVRVRVSTWADPWSVASGKGYQLVQSLFAFGTGGFAGTGLGLGSPDKIPVVARDFIFAAIAEELGLLGTVAVILAFLLLVGSGFRIAVESDRAFSKLFAAGLTTIIGVQTFIIVAGVTRVIPLTGITLPFVAYGGSSLVMNFVILALLLRMSDENAARAETTALAATPVRVPSGR